MRFVEPEPVRTIGLAWRRTSPRKNDFVALGQIVSQTLASDPVKALHARQNKKGGLAPPFFDVIGVELFRGAALRGLRLVAAFGALLAFEVLAGGLIHRFHR